MTTTDRILALIREHTPEGGEEDGAITARDLAKLTGFHLGKARETIRELVEAGKMEPVRVPRANIVGQVQTVWAYRVVGA